MSRQPILTGLPGFDEFWARYPRHVAKGAARKAWEKLAPSPALVETMIQALVWQRQQAQWLKDGGDYVPHAATWIRGERWTDERPKTKGADPWNQQAKTEEVRRLVQRGLSSADANRLVFK